jgi:hypothetical protein
MVQEIYKIYKNLYLWPKFEDGLITEMKIMRKMQFKNNPRVTREIPLIKNIAERAFIQQTRVAMLFLLP